MIKRDKHMNIFEEYTHSRDDKMPLENNLTRALAISLDESPDLMKQFIDYINQNIFKDYPLEYNEEYTVDIQFDLDRINEFDCIDKIYGITLTTEKHKFEDKKIEKSDKKEITDVVISLGESVIIIEAKRDATNPTEQLGKQKNKAIEKYSGGIEPHCEGMAWEDIFKIIEKYSGTKKGSKDRIIYDFNEFLYRHLAGCAPEKKLNEIEDTRDNYEELVVARLIGIKNNYLDEYIDNKDELEYSRQIIPLEQSYLKECDLQYESNNKEKNIYIVMHIGSKMSQYWNFRKSSMSKALFDIKSIDDCKPYSIPVEIQPNLKIYNTYSHIKDFEVDCVDVDEYQDLVCQYTLDEKEVFVDKNGKGFLEKVKSKSDILFKGKKKNKKFEKFKNEFHEIVKGKKLVNCCAQFRVRFKIPFEVARELDKKNKMPCLIHQAIKKVLPKEQ
ncbi:MAG: hypothetical protein K6E58_04235 [Eubacterium sp.]|nr:hypothetical protein [Eubacterium sp.]